MLKGNTGVSDMRNIMKKWHKKNASVSNVGPTKAHPKNKYTLQDKKSLTVQSPRDTRIIPPSPKDLLSSLKITDMKQKSQLNTGSESFTNQRISFQIKKLQIEDLHHQLMQKPRESVTVAIN